MREIKFRAFDNINELMLESLSIRQLLSEPSLGDDDIDNLTIMQYTGLKDANGVEIYEGDIVRVWNGNKTTISHDGFQFCIGKKQRPMKEYEASDMKVIGNIYQHKELLNGN